MRARLVIGCALLLASWLTRLPVTNDFPPFLDEAIHIYYSETAAGGNPLAYSQDGRQFAIWLYALFQVHSGAPIFAARVVTALVTMVGFAALVAAGGLLAGQLGAALSGLLLLISPYHLFFENLALADPVSAGLALVGVYFAVRLTRRASLIDAALCGAALFLGVGAKVTALPLFVVVPAAALLIPRRSQSWAQRIQWAAIALAVGLGLTAAYLAGLYAFGYNALTYVFDGAGAPADGPLAALTVLSGQMAQRALRVAEDVGGYVSAGGLALLLVGALRLALNRWRFLPVVLVVSTAAYLASSRVETRHVIAPVSLLLLCGGVALAEFLKKLPRGFTIAALAGISAAGLLLWLPFASAVGRDPASLPLPPADYAQYIASDASGLGLKELCAELEALRPREVIALIANCQGLRYLALGVVPVTCAALNPSGANVLALLELLESRRAPGVYAALEAIPYVPASAPGKLVTTLTFPIARPALAIYDLAP
ncbi:MAG: ArnT family glycosyltransferase [Aggregatilineales bacterium]